MARRLRQSRAAAHRVITASRGAAAPREESHHDALVRRARRFRRRGEYRQAMLSLREACHTGAQCPRLWTLYAVACVRVRRIDDAKHALQQALWLRQRAKDAPRVQVIERLLSQLDAERFPLRAA